jgi:hypothetical protein
LTLDSGLQAAAREFSRQAGRQFHAAALPTRNWQRALPPRVALSVLAH